MDSIPRGCWAWQEKTGGGHSEKRKEFQAKSRDTKILYRLAALSLFNKR